ncbi:MAG: NADH-quinone oxidoreductase subunit NuoH [Candidatus Omnitrophica bacterium CG11_big_fil_rev_8_21_14_0_20_45_26]|uniref:NADH-quinone oxidoreductase subunit H n=1 Tax=Candidatus Abzuiibacterium crystallinum TaxID=1974748 RepID=A0A2H0LME0_9BACT|nr:MAG: NADH-quinone oxidoreductase subunit NuoH [Candidatus Omnitrophica bacterium CG11_big_fil_rev_8_21_14_0_20_45_26]PIW63676.1 MAG: NADH-quinone oxidoreductase subunit NuoH [Candidatus Omnitrophica bacterium CG12_big_fil_rev_8_21_14_0_65_45_16]
MDQLFVHIDQAIIHWAQAVLPDWMAVIVAMKIPIVAIAIFGPVTMMYLTLIERKLLARIQNRFGPNRVGKFGLLQPLADGVKMLTKEDIVPEKADKIAHLLAPILIVIPALLVFAVLPFGRNMIAVDLNIGVLFFLAMSGTTTLFIFTAAWASHNKFSLLGGMRSVAQMISYEIPFVLSVVPVLVVVGSFSTVAIVEAQPGLHWFVFTPWGAVGFFIFFICAVAEVNRTPFDLPEAESELVAGFHTEYSGMKFALFYMAEFMNVFTVSALVATVFLGGWQGPILPSWVWFLLKTYTLILIMMWFRGTFPRLRADQLMGFAWKFLLELTFVNIIVAAIWYEMRSPLNHLTAAAILIVTIIVLFQFNKTEIPKKRIYKYAYAD